MDTVRTVLAGVGGYGVTYLKTILDHPGTAPVELEACVDPFASNSPYYSRLQEAGIPVYDTLEACFHEHQADLAVLSTPILFHREQSLFCLSRGLDVLCEKPVAPIIDDAYDMISARDQAGAHLSIGYQWSHSEAIQSLKRDIMEGKYGQARRLKSIVLWPRDVAYYHRGTGWAGKKKNAEGAWILDSVASNATAHYLHNMLYVLGDQLDRSASSEEMEVEVYRANPIETFDTCAMRLHTQQGAEILFLVSHAIEKEQARQPEFVFEFEKGAVYARMNENKEMQIWGELQNGEIIRYGNPEAGIQRKLVWAAEVKLGRKQVICGPEAAMEHTKCVNLTAELIPEAPYFPKDRIVFNGSMYYCQGLAQMLNRCYEEWKMPGEYNTPGFAPAQKGSLKGYRHFRGL